MTTEAPTCLEGKAHYWVFDPQVPGQREQTATCKRCHKPRSWPTFLEPSVFRSTWRKRAPRSDEELTG